MLRNESSIDRTIRIVVGLFLLSLVFVGPESAWGWLGLVLVITGLLGNCPLYSVFGFATCSARGAR